MIRVEKAMLRDVGSIIAIEIKAQEFPITSKDIQDALIDTTREVYVALLGNKIVGTATMKFDKVRRHVTIERISTHPEFRKVGVSKAILEKVTATGWADGMDKMLIMVPEYMAMPLDPDSINDWLWKCGFKATGTINDWYFRYCRTYDAYQFERAL